MSYGRVVEDAVLSLIGRYSYYAIARKLGIDRITVRSIVQRRKATTRLQRKCIDCRKPVNGKSWRCEYHKRVRMADLSRERHT